MMPASPTSMSEAGSSCAAQRDEHEREHHERDVAFERRDVLLVRNIDVPEHHPGRGGGGDTGLGRDRVRARVGDERPGEHEQSGVPRCVTGREVDVLEEVVQHTGDDEADEQAVPNRSANARNSPSVDAFG